MGDIMAALLGYKIFDTLTDFYNWQGYNGNPTDGTVNKVMGYSTTNPLGTYRYTKPYPHPSVDQTDITLDQNDMPTAISGSELRVCCVIDVNCPDELMGQAFTDSLISLSAAQTEGWFISIL